MSGLLNKLTGHHNKDQTTESHEHGTPYTANNSSNTSNAHHNNQTTTTTTQTTTNNAALPNQSLHQQQAVGGVATTAPYGASTATSTQRTGAAYTDASVAGVNNHVAVNQQQQGVVHDDAITRSEEQLRLAKATVETGVAQLNKYVSVDHVEKKIPISRERLVIERFPINEANIGSFGNAIIGEQHFETTICEDRVAALKEIVPIERIRLAKEVESRVENVEADLRKEHVDYVYQPLAAGSKNDDGLAHQTQARHDQAYDANRKMDSSYDQAAQYKHGAANNTNLPHHSSTSGVHSSGAGVMSDKIDNLARSGHGLGAGSMQGNALSTGTGSA